MDQFPHVRVEGTAIERGRQYGTQARQRVRRSVEVYREVFAHYTGWDWPDVQREAARFERPVAEFRPAYLEEMRGIADGADLDLLDVLAINVRTEIMFAATARQAIRGRRIGECSAFAVVPPPGRPGPVLTGQNWDWLPHCTDTVVVLEARQDDGPAYVTVVEGGLLAKAGMNSAGLGLVTNALVTADDAGTPGIPYHVALRAILDCDTVSQALAVLQSGLRSSAANYLITHRDGSVLNVEAAPGGFSNLYLLYPASGVLLHTNHFLSQGFAGTDVSLYAMPDSAVRLQRLRAGFAGAVDPPSLGLLRTLLADHANHPSGVCCHPDSRDHLYEQGATVASLLMDLSAPRMWIAEGNPCSVPYKELDLLRLFQSPAHRSAGRDVGTGSGVCTSSDGPVQAGGWQPGGQSTAAPAAPAD
jgi:isopenicillin-N N-acyltransferase-like protein